MFSTQNPAHGTATTTPNAFPAAPFIAPVGIVAPAGIGAPIPYTAGPAAHGAPVTGTGTAGEWDFSCIAASIPAYEEAAMALGVYMDEVFGQAQMCPVCGMVYLGHEDNCVDKKPRSNTLPCKAP